MADVQPVKVSALPDSGVLDGSESVVMNQNGATCTNTTQAIASLPPLLNSGDPLVGSESIPMLQNGNYVVTTAQEIADLGGGSGPLTAFAYFNGASGAIISSDSLNVANIIKGTAGVYTVQLSQTFTAAPVAVGSVSDAAPSWTSIITSQTVGIGTSGFIITFYKNGVATNPTAAMFMVMGK